MKLTACLFTIFLWGVDGFAAAPKNLVVHEWGVFRVNEQSEMANADLRAVWDGLPEFVYGHVRGRQVPLHWGAVEIRDRPILFFHAEQAGQFTLQVEFPGGMPGVWWPGTQSPAIFGNQKQPPITKQLQWELSVQQPAPGWHPKTPAPPAVEKGHWFERLREVKADEIFARFGPGGNYVEREKFLYYDGLFPQAKWLKFDVNGDDVAVTNRAKHAVFDVTIVDRRDDLKIRIGRLDQLDAGGCAKMTFADAGAARFQSEAGGLLSKQLQKAGLFADEARSLVDLWSSDMFAARGLHAFYRLPAEEYDRLLPLSIKPPPQEIVRVGLIYHGHIEPDLAGQIQDLIRQMDSPRFAVREAARKKMLQIGPAALVHLLKLHKEDLSTEVWKQVETFIKQWNAREAFE